MKDSKNDIDQRLAAIEARNARVELEKAWEVSWARRLCIAALIYIVVVVYLLLIDNDNPFVNAGVPAVGYVLSTLVLRQVREMWQNRSK